MPAQAKQTVRRIKRVQEMRNQLENLRKELVADAISNSRIAQKIDTVDAYLKILSDDIATLI